VLTRRIPSRREDFQRVFGELEPRSLRPRVYQIAANHFIFMLRA
jgi:hypothetical protein